MKIKELAIDRYGAWSKLRLSGLDDRLNVIHGANLKDTSEVVQFLHAMLYGFARDPEGSATEIPTWGGSLTVEGPHGRGTIRRHANGTRTGRLTLLGADGASIDRDVLPEWLSGVDESVYRALFAASFHEAAPTERLVETALSQGFELAEGRLTASRELEWERPALRRSEDHRREVEQLAERRRAVEAEIEELERNGGRVAHVSGKALAAGVSSMELHRVRDEIERCETELARLRRDLQALDDEINAWEQRRAGQSVIALAAPDPAEGDQQTLEQRLHVLQSQWERWRRVRHDVRRRRTRLRRELLSWTAAADSPAVLWNEAQSHIAAIENKLEQLQAEIHALANPPAGQSGDGRDAELRCAPHVQAVRNEVYNLCRELNRHYLDERRQEITGELRQLRRCFSEVDLHLKRLARRKERVQREMELQNAAIAPTRLRRHEAAERLRLGQAELARLHDEQRAIERRPLPAHWGQAQGDSRLDARRRELDAIHREIDARLEKLAAQDWSGARMRSAPRPATAPLVIEEAGRYLRRLTDGQFVHVHVRPGERLLGIENARGECLSLESQGRSVRDRVHLSLCLALAAAHARRGVRLPLILDGALDSLDAAQAEHLALVLREFAGQGHQAFVFTCREQVARLFQRLDVSVLELPTETSLHEHHLLRWTAEPATPAAVRREPSGPRLTLDDELPPPLGDRYSQPGHSRRGRDAVRSPKHFLHRADAIQYAPDVDPAVAHELASQGTTTVGDFLSLSPVVADQKLTRLGISAETVRQWQATARLMCDTVRLRAYDARLLVAAGITSREELEHLAPEELLERVERCLATEEGQRLFRLGDDEELARLASWIGSGRGTQLLRETQSQHWTRRARGPRLGPWYDEPHFADAFEPEATVNTLIPGESPLVRHEPDCIADERPLRRARFHLDFSNPISQAPSVGQRTAERLRAIGVNTVADLLTVSPESAARRIGFHHITAQTLRDWQAQARLVCTTPELRAHDAQILVACGVNSVERLAESDPIRLFDRVEQLAATPAGQRLLSDGGRPDLAEVAHWVACGRNGRRQPAA